MANYPTSVFAPAAKATGDVVQATHINDLQNEVVAIESGLLNGTAPLTSSNTIVNLLSVVAQPQASVISPSTTSLPDNTWTTLSFTEQRFNIGSVHSTGTNPSRLTARSSGLFHIIGGVAFFPNSSGTRGVRIIVNGSTTSTGVLAWTTHPGVAGVTQSFQATVLYRLPSSADYVELQAFQNTGAALESNSTAGIELGIRNQFMLAKLS